jgi:signal transduction histidine kinase/PAS domain-containing protein
MSVQSSPFDTDRASETKYKTLFELIDEGFCVIEVLFDDANRPVDYRFIETNPAFVKQTGLEHAVGRTVRELAPELEPYWFEFYGKVALTGEPARFEGSYDAVNRWYDVYAARVGEPAERRVAVLFTNRTAAKAAERERERLLSALEIERSRLATVFAQSPSILALVRGPNHILELANDAYLDLIGRRDAVGKPLLEAVTELRGQGFEKLLDAVVETGEPFIGREVPTLVSRSADAPPEERYFDFVYLPVTEVDGSRSGVIAHGTDITEQVRARREAERLLAESERARAEAEAAGARSMRLYALTAALSMSATPEEVAEAVIAHAPAVLEAVGVVIARTAADGRSLEIMRAGDMPDEVRDSWRRFPMDSPVPLADVTRTGQAVFLESRAEWGARYPAMAPLLDATGHHANAVAPLVVHGAVLGALGAAFRAPRRFSEVDRALVLTVAQQCAQALERARLFEAERAARDEAEAANRAKSEFLAVMSHELRTPLNAIGGYAELMEMGIRGPINAQQIEDLRRIQASQRHLLGLVNEVLNYARIETGTVHYDITDVPLTRVVASVEPLVAPQLTAKGLTYVANSCDPAPVARADYEKVRQVMLNLLSNAIKFTDSGGRVEVSCERTGERVHIRVRDTGIGIARHELERVFEPFVQVNASLTRTQEGTGLGLAISRDLARGMGGDLTAVSEPDIGSTFTLSLPAA